MNRSDALLKLLLKYSREKDVFRKLETLMNNHRKIFLSLSVGQARFIFEYILHVGKGTPKNAEAMKASMNQIYGETKASEFFSLADYFREEARKKAIKEGREEGREEGRLEGEKKAIQKLLQQGVINQKQAQRALRGLN